MQTLKLSIKETVILTTLPSGYTNSIAVRNRNPSITNTNLSRVFDALCKEQTLIKCSCSYRNPSEHRTHTYDYYLITPQGILRYFPLLSVSFPVLRIWCSLHPALPVNFSTRPDCNSTMIERNLRVLEVEQFCSGIGSLSTIDPRPCEAPSVFGCAPTSAIDSSCMKIGLGEAVKLYKRAVGTCEADEICEAVQSYEVEKMRSREAMGTCEAVEEENCEAEGTCKNDNAAQRYAQKNDKNGNKKDAKTQEKNSVFYDFKSDEFISHLIAEKNDQNRYSFYRSRELCLGDIDRKKDPALIRSSCMGILVKGERIIMLYSMPRSNGLIWNRKAEERAMQNALMFCNTYLGTMLPNTDYLKEAIIFYRNDREMLSTLNGTVARKRAIKYEDFGAPFQNVYAIPFSKEGQHMLQFILDEKESWKVTAEEFCESHPDFEITGDEKSIYPISYFGLPVMQAYPLDLRKLARHMTLAEEDREQVTVINGMHCEKILKRTAPELEIRK